MLLPMYLVITEKEAVIKQFRNDTFDKKMIITATEIVLIQLFSDTAVSKHKTKMKTQNNMAPSYHSQVTSTQNKGVPFFSCLTHGV